MCWKDSNIWSGRCTVVPRTKKPGRLQAAKRQTTPDQAVHTNNALAVELQEITQPVLL